MKLIGFLDKWKIYHMSFRPYKYVFYRYFKKCLKLAEPYTTIIDCASAGDKHRYLFKGKKYSGVDCDQKLIDRAQKNRDENSYYYCDNILQPKSGITNMQFDCCVSTHTLAHIDNSQIHLAISNLLKLTDMKHGKLIIQFVKGQEDVINNALNNCNYNITIILKFKYGGKVSFIFESFLCRIFNVNDVFYIQTSGGSLKSKFTNLVIYSISFILSFLDPMIPPFSQHMYYIQMKKR
jgi:predicted RNA-binding Zn-ribbon protein involved in translation (DUF1610 family)